MGAAIGGICMVGWHLLRLLKFLALLSLAVGMGAAFVHPRQAARARATFGVVSAALLVSWLAGYLLLKETQRSLFEPFVGVGVLASLAAFHGAVRLATSPAPSRAWRSLGVGGLAVATAAMVTRDLEPLAMAACCVAAAAGAVGLERWMPALQDPASGEAAEQVVGLARRFFVVLARLEGLSLLLIFVLMGLRGAYPELRPVSSAVGWVHGSLFLLYLQALQVAGGGWSWRLRAAAVVGALLPFGTFAFEAWGLKRAR